MTEQKEKKVRGKYKKAEKPILKKKHRSLYNTIPLPQSENCVRCGIPILYASKTHFEQTGEHMGMDCWEFTKHEKQQNKNQQNEAKIFDNPKDFDSHFVGLIGSRLKLTVTLEKSIFLYTGNFGNKPQSCFLNIFRTTDGNLIVYKGNSLRERCKSVVEMTCTVKEHLKLYQIEQTVVQRPSIVQL